MSNETLSYLELNTTQPQKANEGYMGKKKKGKKTKQQMVKYADWHDSPNTLIKRND